jgi:hypothetical protein
MSLSYHLRRVLNKEDFLARFKHVRKVTAKGNCVEEYDAYCPAHDTHHHSLAIGIRSDGAYLLYCRAGCSSADVAGAVGLSLADLYPDGAMADRISPAQRPLNARVDDAVLEIAKHTRESGGRLSKADKAKEREAWLRARKDQSWPKVNSNA